MKINLKSGKKINPMRSGKRVRTSLRAGEKYNTKEDFLLAYGKSNDDFQTFYDKEFAESMNNNNDSIGSIVMSQYCFNSLKAKGVEDTLKTNQEYAKKYMKAYC